IQAAVAGGFESMSNVPHFLRGMRGGIKFRDAAERHTGNDSLRMATKLLDDFRCSRLGAIALELPDQT
ncbi:MAG: hypothetical protein R6W06_01375, partial [Prochlorococcaceae cyanobacterium]